jgi:hypothetical protein
MVEWPQMPVGASRRKGAPARSGTWAGGVRVRTMPSHGGLEDIVYSHERINGEPVTFQKSTDRTAELLVRKMP